MGAKSYPKKKKLGEDKQAREKQRKCEKSKASARKATQANGDAANTH